MEDTPLGRIVLIRKEDDEKVLESYGSYENEVRRRWREFRLSKPVEAAPMDPREVSEHFEKIFARMFS